jgi:hypothetical protein
MAETNSSWFSQVLTLKARKACWEGLKTGDRADREMYESKRAKKK